MTVSLAVVVTSDRVYRGEAEDRIRPLVERLTSEKYRIFRLAYYRVVPNNRRDVVEAVLEASRKAGIILVTGGTGISPRDVSVDAIAPLARRNIPGFGEAHRRISWERIGARAILSRASAYIVNGSIVAITPGNPDAVEIALDLLAPIAIHALEEIQGRGHGKD